MEKYKIKIIERLERVVEIEAEDEIMAVDEVESKVNNSEIILDAEDFTGRDIIVLD